MCHPIWRLGGGGLERQLWNIVTHPSHRAIQHRLIVQNFREPAISPPDNVRVLPGPGSGPDPLWSRRLAIQLQQEQADVLHVRGVSMLLDCVMAADLVDGIRLVFSFHGFENVPVRWSNMRRKLYRAALERCDERWAVSRAAADSLCDELELRGCRFEIIPNGVDGHRFTPAVSVTAAKRALGLPIERRLVLSVGNYKIVKGHDVLLRSLALMRGRASGFTVALVGEDHLSGALQAWTARQLREFDVRFIETAADPLPWYQAADVFVLPSRFEGCSNALLEAMACGLPVAATRVGGNAEAVSHRESGVLVQAEDPAALAAALSELLADERLRESFGERGRRRVLEEFDADRTAAAYSARYISMARKAKVA